MKEFRRRSNDPGTAPVLTDVTHSTPGPDGPARNRTDRVLRGVVAGAVRRGAARLRAEVHARAAALVRLLADGADRRRIPTQPLPVVHPTPPAEQELPPVWTAKAWSDLERALERAVIFTSEPDQPPAPNNGRRPPVAEGGSGTGDRLTPDDWFGTTNRPRIDGRPLADGGPEPEDGGRREN